MVVKGKTIQRLSGDGVQTVVASVHKKIRASSLRCHTARSTKNGSSPTQLLFDERERSDS